MRSAVYIFHTFGRTSYDPTKDFNPTERNFKYLYVYSLFYVCIDTHFRTHLTLIIENLIISRILFNIRRRVNSISRFCEVREMRLFPLNCIFYRRDARNLSENCVCTETPFSLTRKLYPLQLHTDTARKPRKRNTDARAYKSRIHGGVFAGSFLADNRRR